MFKQGHGYYNTKVKDVFIFVRNFKESSAGTILNIFWMTRQGRIIAADDITVKTGDEHLWKELNEIRAM